VALSKDQLQAVPAGLRERAQWVLWRYTQVDGKPRKVPYTTAGGHASHADPKTWAEFDAVVKAMPKYDGVGFVFTESDPYVGIDLDHCYDSQGTLKAWAVDLVRMAQEHECYIERTPSGQGLHIIGVGKLPGHGRKITQIGEDKTGAIEVYDQLRYFTVTGDQTDLGDADGDASNILQWVWRSYGLKDDAASHVEPGVAVADSEADRVAVSLLSRASVEFRSLWADMYDVNRHGTDRSAVRFSFLCQLAMKLATTGAPQTVALLRAVALRAPFIKSEMSSARGQKWPRLADSECTRAWAWVTEHVQGLQGAALTDSNDLLLDVTQLHARYKAQTWAVKGIIPASAIGIIFGASGTFKSFIALDYALHRCYGFPWLGRKTKQGIPVYIAAEGGAGLMRRIEAWHKLRGLDWAQCPMRVVIVPLSLSQQAGALRKAIDALGIVPSDIIVDTLSQTCDGDEKENTVMAAFLRALGAELRDPYGATVIIIHHTGHVATERPRGASALIANSDFLFGVFRDESAMLATVECVKQKDSEKPETSIFDMRQVPLGTDEDGDAISSLVAMQLNPGDAVLAAAKQKRSGYLGLLVQAVGTGKPEKDARTEFYRLMPGASPDSQRQAWHRTKKTATETGILVWEGDFMLVASQHDGDKA